MTKKLTPQNIFKRMLSYVMAAAMIAGLVQFGGILKTAYSSPAGPINSSPMVTGSSGFGISEFIANIESERDLGDYSPTEITNAVDGAYMNQNGLGLMFKLDRLTTVDAIEFTAPNGWADALMVWAGTEGDDTEISVYVAGDDGHWGDSPVKTVTAGNLVITAGSGEPYFDAIELGGIVAKFIDIRFSAEITLWADASSDIPLITIIGTPVAGAPFNSSDFAIGKGGFGVAEVLANIESERGLGDYSFTKITKAVDGAYMNQNGMGLKFELDRMITADVVEFTVPDGWANALMIWENDSEGIYTEIAVYVAGDDEVYGSTPVKSTTFGDLVKTAGDGEPYFDAIELGGVAARFIDIRFSSEIMLWADSFYGIPLVTIVGTPITGTLPFNVSNFATGKSGFGVEQIIANIESARNAADYAPVEIVDAVDGAYMNQNGLGLTFKLDRLITADAVEFTVPDSWANALMIWPGADGDDTEISVYVAGDDGVYGNSPVKTTTFGELVVSADGGEPYFDSIELGGVTARFIDIRFGAEIMLWADASSDAPLVTVVGTPIIGAPPFNASNFATGKSGFGVEQTIANIESARNAADYAPVEIVDAVDGAYMNQNGLGLTFKLDRLITADAVEFTVPDSWANALMVWPGADGGATEISVYVAGDDGVYGNSPVKITTFGELVVSADGGEPYFDSIELGGVTARFIDIRFGAEIMLWADASSDTPLVTVVGTPEAVDDLFRVTFDLNSGVIGGSPDAIVRKTASGGSVTPPNPSKTNYSLDGWFTSAVGGDKVTNFTNITKDATYYAQYKLLRYTISFDLNGGVIAEDEDADTVDITVDIFEDITPPTPTKEGYTLIGWSSTADAVESKVNDDAFLNVTADRRLYALWDEVAQATCDITFVANGGTPVAPITVPGDSILDKPVSFKNESFLSGWYTDSGFTTKWNFKDAVKTDMTLYAKWIPAGEICFIPNPLLNLTPYVFKGSTTEPAANYGYEILPNETLKVSALGYPATTNIKLTHDIYIFDITESYIPRALFQLRYDTTLYERFTLEDNMQYLVAKVTVTPSSEIKDGYYYEKLEEPVILHAGRNYSIFSNESATDSFNFFYGLGSRDLYFSDAAEIITETMSWSLKSIPLVPNAWTNNNDTWPLSDSPVAVGQTFWFEFTDGDEPIVLPGVNYDVTFDLTGGESTSTSLTQSVQGGKFAVEPNRPTKNGFVFAGWSTTLDGRSVNLETYAINADTTFYAKWLDEKFFGIIRIEIKNMPKKTNYRVGERFDPSGMTILVHYTTGVNPDEIDVTRDMIGGGDDFSTPGDKIISIIYKGNLANLSGVNVSERVRTPKETAEPTEDDDAAIDDDATIDDDTTDNADLAWDNPFTDVSEDDWFFDFVEYVYTNGYMNGISGNEFAPDMEMTRGMIVTVLYNIAGRPNVDDLNNPFDDVDDDEWYADPIKWAYENGLILGYGDGNFGPEKIITRQDLLTILMNYANFVGLKLPALRDYEGFSDDGDIADYAKAAVEAFFSAEIVNGFPGGEFRPQSPATRAELAVMIMGLLTL